MNTSSLSELKKELKHLSPTELIDVCLRLAKYKKENKELLHYLLFEAQGEETYIREIKSEMEEQFAEVNRDRNIYYVKKSVRKILRNVNKQIKYSGQKQTEAELLMYFCKLVKVSGIRIQKSTSLTNLYDRQIVKIRKALSSLHEDLQYDYEEDLNNISKL